MEKVLYILRGVSGCGKTTAANFICGEDYVCSADDYFYNLGNGEYAFDPKKLGAAHMYCQNKLKGLMKKEIPRVAVANTSTRASDVNAYRKIAEEFGYMAVVLTVENWHGGVNAHDVPEHALERMETQLKNPIKLR